jgi:hypothetical protein
MDHFIPGSLLDHHLIIIPIYLRAQFLAAFIIDEVVY